MKPPPLTIPHALNLAGISSSRRRTGPCPACGTDRTSRHDSRPPLVHGGNGWRCLSCRAGGDGYALLGYHLGLGAQTESGKLELRGKAFKHVLAFAANGKVQEVQEVQEVQARIDAMPALRAAKPLRLASQPVTEWLANRRIPTSAPAGCLTGWSSAWWPWREGFPLVVPACSGAGEIVSMHGRSVETGEKRWPKGAGARELLFAPPELRAWMRGDAPGPKVLVITEGLSDYLTWASVATSKTIGITSGGARALSLLRLDADCEVFAGTDPGRAGERYVEEIADALWPRKTVRRLDLERVGRAA